MFVRAIRTRVFKEGENLGKFIAEHIPTPQDHSILVVTSKIVALAEGRTASPADFEKAIAEESEWALETKHVYLTMKDGMLLANAGIDASNADTRLVLLPKDSFASARAIYTQIRKNMSIERFGVVITDSRVMPLRAGVTAVALGYAGFKGLRDYRGQKDIFGRELKFTETNVADSLATAAALAMGEGAEQQPLCIIEDVPVEFTNDPIDPEELKIPPEDDMYAPILKYNGKKRD